MSNNSNTSGHNKETRQKRFIRIVCLFLAILMVLSCMSVLVYVFGQWNVSADTYAYDNDLIAVGIEYGRDVTVGFETSTTNGFVVNKTTIERTARNAEPIYSLSENDVFIVKDATLSKVGDEYVDYTTGIVAIGGYHLQISERYVEINGVNVVQRFDINTEDELKALENSINSQLIGTSYNAIPSYISNRYVLRIGDFSTVEKAEKAKEALIANADITFTDDYVLTVVEPSSTGVSIVDPNLNKVLFEYNGDSTSQLGLSAAQKSAYLKTPDSRLYGGTLAYKRYADGVAVSSLIDLEEYVKCVVPWEVVASWNYKALSAFAIVARTYAIRQKNGYFNSYGVDLVDTSASQVYGGYTRVTANVVKAVEETRGKVLYYNDTLANIYYSSLTGGYVVSNKAVWGSSPIPYLNTKATPWENYADRGRGLWMCEVTPTELYVSIREASSCANLTSAIESVTVNSTEGESGYVTSITFKDTAGNVATVGNTTAKVKSVMSDFVYSANFVIGKGSVDYTYDVIKNITITDGEEDEEVEFIEKNPTFFEKIFLSDYYVLNSSKEKKHASESILSMFTFFGRKSVTVSSANVLTADRYKKLKQQGVDLESIYLNASDATVSTPIYSPSSKVRVDVNKITATYTAKDSRNFVIVGKGWGHGVGMSQYGLLDLANAGMSGDAILLTYFPGTNVGDYKR